MSNSDVLSQVSSVFLLLLWVISNKQTSASTLFTAADTHFYFGCSLKERHIDTLASSPAISSPLKLTQSLALNSLVLAAADTGIAAVGMRRTTSAAKIDSRHIAKETDLYKRRQEFGDSSLFIQIKCFLYATFSFKHLPCLFSLSSFLIHNNLSPHSSSSVAGCHGLFARACDYLVP